MEKQRAKKPWARWLSGALAFATAVTMMPANVLNVQAANISTLDAEAAGTIKVTYTLTNGVKGANLTSEQKTTTTDAGVDGLWEVATNDLKTVYSYDYTVGEDPTAGLVWDDEYPGSEEQGIPAANPGYKAVGESTWTGGEIPAVDGDWSAVDEEANFARSYTYTPITYTIAAALYDEDDENILTADSITAYNAAKIDDYTVEAETSVATLTTVAGMAEKFIGGYAANDGKAYAFYYKDLGDDLESAEDDSYQPLTKLTKDEITSIAPSSTGDGTATITVYCYAEDIEYNLAFDAGDHAVFNEDAEDAGLTVDEEDASYATMSGTITALKAKNGAAFKPSVVLDPDAGYYIATDTWTAEKYDGSNDASLPDSAVLTNLATTDFSQEDESSPWVMTSEPTDIAEIAYSVKFQGGTSVNNSELTTAATTGYTYKLSAPGSLNLYNDEAKIVRNVVASATDRSFYNYTFTVDEVVLTDEEGNNYHLDITSTGLTTDVILQSLGDDNLDGAVDVTVIVEKESASDLKVQFPTPEHATIKSGATSIDGISLVNGVLTATGTLDDLKALDEEEINPATLFTPEAGYTFLDSTKAAWGSAFDALAPSSFENGIEEIEATATEVTYTVKFKGSTAEGSAVNDAEIKSTLVSSGVVYKTATAPTAIDEFNSSKRILTALVDDDQLLSADYKFAISSVQVNSKDKDITTTGLQAEDILKATVNTADATAAVTVTVSKSEKAVNLTFVAGDGVDKAAASLPTGFVAGDIAGTVKTTAAKKISEINALAVTPAQLFTTEPGYVLNSTTSWDPSLDAVTATNVTDDGVVVEVDAAPVTYTVKFVADELEIHAADIESGHNTGKTYKVDNTGDIKDTNITSYSTANIANTILASSATGIKADLSAGTKELVYNIELGPKRYLPITQLDEETILNSGVTVNKADATAEVSVLVSLVEKKSILNDTVKKVTIKYYKELTDETPVTTQTIADISQVTTVDLNATQSKSYYNQTAWGYYNGNDFVDSIFDKQSNDSFPATKNELATAIGNVNSAEYDDNTKSYVLNLYAVWDENAYTMEYDGNGGVFSTDTTIWSDSTFKIGEDGKTVELDNNSKNFALAGYDFAGWALSKKATTPIGTVVKDSEGQFESQTVNFEDVIPSGFAAGDPQTLYAIWTPKTMTIVYHAGTGATFASLAGEVDDANLSDKFTYLAGYTAISEKPVLAKKTFVGWSWKGNNDLVSGKITDPFTGISKDNTDNKFNADIDNSKKKAGDNWDHTGSKLNVYAVFNDTNYDITFDLNYADADKIKAANVTETAITGGTANLADAYNSVAGEYTPTRVGFAFKGWFESTANAAAYVKALEDSAATTLEPVTVIPADQLSAKTYYAAWMEKSYVVKYLPGDGAYKKVADAQDQITVKYTGSVTVPDAATLYTTPGNVFDGWTFPDYTSRKYATGVTVKVTDLLDLVDENSLDGDNYVAPSGDALTPGKFFLKAKYTPGNVAVTFANLSAAEEKVVRQAIIDNNTASTTITKTSTVVKTNTVSLFIPVADLKDDLRTGYTLVGWYVGAASDDDCIDAAGSKHNAVAKNAGGTLYDLGDAYGATYNYIAKGVDIVLYAKFEAKTYKVKFQSKKVAGGADTAEQTKVLDIGPANFTETLGTTATKKIGETTDTFTGVATQTFLGWKIAGNDTTWLATNTWADLSKKDLLNAGGTTTLTARWADTYSVIYKYDKDERSAQPVGLLDKLPSNVFTKANSELTGWQVSGSGTVYKAGEKTFDDILTDNPSWTNEAPITLTPVFQEVYTVELQDENGKKLKSFTWLAEDDAAKTITEKSDYTDIDMHKKGYVFNGMVFGTAATVYKLNVATMGDLLSLYGTGDKKVYSIALKAKYTAGTYTVEFIRVNNADTEDTSTIASVVYTYDEKDESKTKLLDGTALTGAAATTAAKTGYSISGWNSSMYMNGTAYANGAVAKNLADAGATVKLYAVYAEKSYTVAFKSNEAQFTKVLGTKFTSKITGKESEIQVKNGEALPATPFAATGMKFLGWTTNTADTVVDPMYADKAKVADELLTAIDKAANGKLTLYAVWAVAQYKVTYHTNSDTLLPEVYYTTEKELALTNPTNTDTHYTFKGWFTGATFASNTALKTNASGSYVIPAGSTGDKDVYALWSPNDVTITFKANDGASTADKIQTTKYMTATKLNGNSFKNKGYVFGGWHLGSATGTTIFNDGQTLTAAEVNGNLTLYADWKKAGEEFKITLNTNDGALAEGDVQATAAVGKFVNAGGGIYTGSYVYGQKGYLPTPTKENYTFTGWTDDVTKKGVKEITAKTSQNLNLTAGWKGKDLTVTFVDNAATVGTTKVTGTMKPVTVEYGKNYKLPAGSFKATGWRIIGWSEKVNGNIVLGGEGGKIGETIANLTENKTFYAQWERIPYGITMYTHGGKVTGTSITEGEENSRYTQTYYLDQGKQVVLPTVVTRDGWTFQGWFTKLENGKYSGKATKLTAGKEQVQTVHAKWAANVTINFYGEDNTTIVGTQVVPMKSFEKAVPLNPVTTTKDKKVFTGWQTWADATYPRFLAGQKSKITVGEFNLTTIGSSNGGSVVLNLYPVFDDEKSIYTVYLHTNYGIGDNPAPTEVRYTVGAGLNSKELKNYAPTYAYGKFSYWSTAGNASNGFKVTSIGKNAKGDLHLYAQYNNGKTSIVYDYSNANYNPAGVKGKTVKQSIKLGKSAASKKINIKAPGYMLLGWTYNKDKAGVYTWKQLHNDDVENWDQTDKQVNYDVNGDGVIADYQYVHAADKETKDVHEVSAFRNDFDIAAMNGSTISYQTEYNGYYYKDGVQKRATFTKNVNTGAMTSAYAVSKLELDKATTLTNTLYPVWVANEYAINYELEGGHYIQGGNNQANTWLYYYPDGVSGREYTKADGDFQVPYRAGYTFTGWKVWNGTLDKKGNKKWAKLGKAGIFNLKYVSVTSGATLQAQWKLNK